MLISGHEVGNDLIMTYVRIINNPTPADWAAWARARSEIHCAIFDAAGVWRDNESPDARAFVRALEDVVSDLSM